MSDPLTLDNSALVAVARCSTEAWLRYYLGYTTVEERAPLKAGTSGHEAMAVWFRGGTREEVLDTFANGAILPDGKRSSHGYQAWADENVPLNPKTGALDRLSHENTSAVLAAWLDTHPVHAFPFRIRGPEYVEIGFAYPLADDVVICGRIDAVAESLEDHELYIVENKFPGRINDMFTKPFAMGSQGSTYLWAAGQHMSGSVLGMYVNAVEFSKLPSDTKRKCTIHGVVFAECGQLHANSDLLIVHRTPEQIEAWKENALALARRFARLIKAFPTLDYMEFVPQEGWFNGLCGQCGFFDFCKTGRRNMGMLVYDPWNPLDSSGAERAASGSKP